MFHRISAFLLLASVAVLADPPPGYYNSAEAKTGADLRAALHSIIRSHHVIPYSSTSFDTSDALKLLDPDQANTNNVIGIYSRESEPASSSGLTTGWNREHLWCDSYGLDGREPAYSDLHNLRAEDLNVNSARGNKFFDLSDTDSAGYRFPAHAEAPLASTDTDSWEPPASVKGDIARSLLYMAIRYTGGVANEPRLVLTDNTAAITSTNTFMGRYTTVLKWHFADPVSTEERTRNDGVYSYQLNRNPFVDRPEWVAAAFIPALSISRSGTSVVLMWTNDFAPSAVAEQATNLASGWLAVTNVPVLTSNDTWAITLPLEGRLNFYRLRID